MLKKEEEEQNLINKAIEENILSAELDDYEYLAKVIEDSYHSAVKEDEILLELIKKENIEVNKHDWCEEDSKTLMKGKNHIIIKLKCI